MTVIAGRASGGDDGGRDYPLTQTETTQLMRELARSFNTEDRAMLLLRQVGFPGELIPDFSGRDSITFWSLIFADLGNGAAQAPYRRLIAAARGTYLHNTTFAKLEQRYESTASQTASAQPEPARQPAQAAQLVSTSQPSAAQQAAGTGQTCHLVAWIGSDEERARLEDWLTRQGLQPQLEWSTLSSLSYRVAEPDPHALNRVMRSQRGFPWTVAPPGASDYVLRFLHVEGPDGRSFRFSDVPSTTPVSSVASELVGQYTEGLPGADDHPTVVDHVGAGGPRRMNPESTLGDEGVTEGDRLRVGFERRAAAVNPLDRRDALFRVRNQLLEYTDEHPGFVLAPNSPALPTEYDVAFPQPSFGPPEILGWEPVDISAHQLSIVLPPDFPIVAPRVRWLTDVFHPNVYPTYESEPLRERPYARGLVCLGTLAESYQPSLDFSDLLRDARRHRRLPELQRIRPGRRRGGRGVRAAAAARRLLRPGSGAVGHLADGTRADHQDRRHAGVPRAVGPAGALQVRDRARRDRAGRMSLVVEIFRSDDYVPDGEIPLVPVLRAVFEDIIGPDPAGVVFELFFYRLLDLTLDRGRPALENLRASHGFVRVRILRDGELVYQHPHPVRELIGEPLRGLLRKRDPEVTHWGYGVRGPGLEAIALTRPALRR